MTCRSTSTAASFPRSREVPIWVTLSGGDQFLRADLDEIVRLMKTQINPKIVNIPMNGVITERIFTLLPKIAAHTRGSSLVLNLSVDEIGTEHDRLRGAPGNWDKLLGVAELIRDLKTDVRSCRPRRPHRHLEAQRRTASRRSSGKRAAIFQPDSYITEVAENRVELQTMRQGHRAGPGRLPAQPSSICRRDPRESLDTVRCARLVESLRLEYYDLASAGPRGEAPGHRLLCRLGERAPRA